MEEMTTEEYNEEINKIIEEDLPIEDKLIKMLYRASQIKIK